MYHKERSLRRTATQEELVSVCYFIITHSLPSFLIFPQRIKHSILDLISVRTGAVIEQEDWRSRKLKQGNVSYSQ